MICPGEKIIIETNMALLLYRESSSNIAAEHSF